MEPTSLLAQALDDRVDERGGVVVQGRLELGDALGGRHGGVLLDGPSRLGRDDAQL